MQCSLQYIVDVYDVAMQFTILSVESSNDVRKNWIRRWRLSSQVFTCQTYEHWAVSGVLPSYTAVYGLQSIMEVHCVTMTIHSAVVLCPDLINSVVLFNLWMGSDNRCNNTVTIRQVVVKFTIQVYNIITQMEVCLWKLIK